MADSKKNEVKPHLKVCWCIPKVDGAFLAKMEDVLDLYARPYDEQYPVVCFDERPFFLIEDTIAPLPTQEVKIAKEHYIIRSPQAPVPLA